MIHRGIISTMERFTAHLTEMYKGAFPTWLAPQQVRIIPVNREAHGAYAEEIKDTLVKQGIRAEYDDRNEKMGYLIRDAQTSKVPYTLVVGDEEVNNHSVTVRHFGSTDTEIESFDEFQKRLLADIANHSRGYLEVEAARDEK
jgi:threonyl-tRNA synthetase